MLSGKFGNHKEIAAYNPAAGGYMNLSQEQLQTIQDEVDLAVRRKFVPGCMVKIMSKWQAYLKYGKITELTKNPNECWYASGKDLRVVRVTYYDAQYKQTQGYGYHSLSDLELVEHQPGNNIVTADEASEYALKLREAAVAKAVGEAIQRGFISGARVTFMKLESDGTQFQVNGIISHLVTNPSEVIFIQGEPAILKILNCDSKWDPLPGGVVTYKGVNRVFKEVQL